MSPHESMVRRTRWDSVADPARLAEYVPTGAVTHMIPSRNRHELPGPDGRPAADKAEAIFELMTKLGIRYVLEPADSQPGAQFVRPVEEVFRDSGQGTCLDLCVAFSSAALDAGLHPMILTVTKSNTGNKSDKKCHSIVLIPRNRTWSASGRPEPVADHEVVHEPFLFDDMPLKAMVYRTATGSGDLLAIDVQEVSRKPDGTPFGDWESAVSRGADFLTGKTGWDWDVCVDIGALRGAMEAPQSVYAPPRARVLEPGYLKPSPGATRSPLQLIKARTGIVPFTGREKLTGLTDWANKQPKEGREDLAVAVVTGVGGSGKTRLAAELCSNLEKTGWVAGFIPKTAKLSEAELIWLTRVESHLLLVLDYAEESHKEELTRLLRRLRERGAPTRVVLTARSAGAWLDDLLEDDVLSGAMAQGLRRFEVPRQAETSTKIAKRAAKRFARYLETPEPDDVVVPQNSRWTTLDFVFHGWLIASEVGAADLPSSREELYEEILRREFTYWQDEAAKQGLGVLSEKTWETAVATLSLLGPASFEETREVLSRLPRSDNMPKFDEYAQLLFRLLAVLGERCVLRPDPIAERLIIKVFVDDGETLDVPEELLGRVLPPDPMSESYLNEATCPPAATRRAKAHKAQSKHACEAITRCTSQGDAPAAQLAHSALRYRTHLWVSGLEVASRQGGPFVAALEDALRGGMDLPAAEIADSIPPHEHLCDLAITAMLRDRERDMSPAERAARMKRYAFWLNVAGDSAGALEAIREAVGIYTELASENFSTFGPMLADSFNDLSIWAYVPEGVGASLDAAQKAVKNFRKLAKEGSVAFPSGMFAMSLLNLSGWLSEAGDCCSSVEAVWEAVGVYRDLIDEDFSTFSSWLVDSLKQLSSLLSNVGDYCGSVEAAWEAVGVYRDLADGGQSTFYSKRLASLLSYLSTRLYETGDCCGAVDVIREAVEISRRLVVKDSAAFSSELADSLFKLSSRLSGLGDYSGAMEALWEAIGIYRRLAEGGPEEGVPAFYPELARSLFNISLWLYETGDYGGSVDAAWEAVKIYRGLFVKDPTTFSSELANSLFNLSIRLFGLGDCRGAMEAVREAIEIYRGLAEEGSGEGAAVLCPDLARSLFNLSCCLYKTGDCGGAVDAAREAVEIYRGLAVKDSATFSSGLADSLFNLSVCLFKVDDYLGAARVVREAIEIYREFAAKGSVAFSSELADSLFNLSAYLLGLEDYGGALEAAWEVVEIRNWLAADDPIEFVPKLASSLFNLSGLLFKVDDFLGAVRVAWDAVRIYRRLAESNPAAFETGLVSSLNNLARIVTGTGETDEALRCFTDDTESFSTGLQARLWLARARWQGEVGGVDALCHAAELADAQDDPRLLGRVRRAIAETVGEWRATIPTEQWEELPGWAVRDLSEHLETLQAWLQCSNWDEQAQLLRFTWPAPTEDDVALTRAAAEKYIDVPEMSILADAVEAIAEQGHDPIFSKAQAVEESMALVSGWRTAHVERKGRQFLKEHQNVVGNSCCREVLQRFGLPSEECRSLLALLDLATVSSVDIAYDVAEDLEDADDAIRDFIDVANFLGMYCVLRVRPDLAEGTPHGRFAAALCAYLTGHPEEGRRYLDLIGTTANPDDRESFRRCVHTLGRDPDYTDALAPVAEWLRTG